jgi:NADPH-dependent glutamate synthase beta chain and related oxidoreductases
MMRTRSRNSACRKTCSTRNATTSSTSASFRGGKRIDSMKALLAEDFDAIFVGCGAPRGRDLDIPGRKEAAKNIHIGIDWLSSVSFGHIDASARVSCSAAATPRWTAAAPRAGSAARRERSWCAPASRR